MKIVLKNKKKYFYEKVMNLKRGRYWANSIDCVARLELLQKKLLNLESYFSYNRDGNNYYIYKNFIWNDLLIYSIKNHGYIPSSNFLDKILMDNLDQIKYIKLTKNQLLILDALLLQGGYKRRYLDSKKFKYSEHMGVFVIVNNKISEIKIQSTKKRIDEDDDEIILPGNFKKITKYHYVFHTHPPTPKPGSRINEGILYEFPSIDDILHFIHYHNIGKLIGSIVVAPEGVYIIQKATYDKKKINIDTDKFKYDFEQKMYYLQNKAIKKYNKFIKKIKEIKENCEKKLEEYFYELVAQDTKYIVMLNDILSNYQIMMKYFPRYKNKNNEWVNNDIYLPIYL